MNYPALRIQNTLSATDYGTYSPQRLWQADEVLHYKEDIIKEKGRSYAPYYGYCRVFFISMWVTLEIRVPFRILVIMVPYYIGDLNGDPNVEKCQCRLRKAVTKKGSGRGDLRKPRAPLSGLPIGSIVVPLFRTYKVIPKRNYYGAYG